MKNKILAFATFGVLGTVGSGVLAQDSVSVYGLVDLGIVSERGGPAGSVLKMSSGVESGSRIGFRGKEDLGGGLAAQFVLESGVAADTGGTNQGGVFWGRQAYVGLTGGFGTVNVGRQYNPITNVLITIDPFAEGLEGAATNIVTYALRMNNAVLYTTPAMNGFTSQLAYGFGEVAGNTSGNRQLGLAFSYANGPIYAGFAHHSMNDATAANTKKIDVLGGTYNFGPAKAALAYAVNKDNVSIDSNDILVGVSVPFGASTFLASYIRHNDKSNLNQDARQIAIGYTYALSKRTDLYTSYAQIKNNNGAGFTVGNAIETGTGNKGLAVGIRHKF
jgi:predicted porin